MSPRRAAAPPLVQRMLLFLGNRGVQMRPVSRDANADGGRPIRCGRTRTGRVRRLQTVRTQRGMTLTGGRASRPASPRARCRGWRRASDDPPSSCSLPLSHAYRVPLDDLVGAPEVGDPRIRLKPGPGQGPHGDPADPAAGRHAGLEDRDPDQQGRPGAARARRLRVDLRPVRSDAAASSASRTWSSGPGEVVEFDTQVPHWFGSTGDEPAEILSIFGRPGERMRHRPPRR